MRVLVKQALAGNSKPYPIQQGEQELPDDVARDLISRGLADAIGTPEKRAEKAEAKPKQVRKRTTKRKAKE